MNDNTEPLNPENEKIMNNKLDEYIRSSERLSKMKKYRNRYGDTYYYEPVGEKTFKFVMEGDSMKWCRWGGKDGQQSINMNDLGMFDPSGGPYVGVGVDIAVGTVKRIYRNEEHFMIEVE